MMMHSHSLLILDFEGKYDGPVNEGQCQHFVGQMSWLESSVNRVCSHQSNNSSSSNYSKLPEKLKNAVLMYLKLILFFQRYV